MDRSRRMGARGRATTAEAEESAIPPSSSRLTLRARKNRRRPTSVWTRVPRPRAIADACGRALRRSLPVLLATCAVLGVVAALWLGYQFVTTSARYAITSIEVRGAERLSADEVRATLPVALGDNIFTTSPDEVARALRQNPWIVTAMVERILPGTLSIELREREPTAIAVLGEPYLVAADGRPFKRARIEAGEGADLPVVTGLDRAAYLRDPAAAARAITAALAALARWQSDEERPAIGEVHLGAQGTLTLRTSEHRAAIELGPIAALGQPGPDGQALDARLATFDAAWAVLDEHERQRARTFHLDARSERVTVAFAKD
jgi:cell division protein FtsQ